MLVKQQLVNVSYFMVVKHIKLEKFMRVKLQWTEWFRKKKEE